MSKEIQCKCCKEYWWENNIHSKSGLCPNCYDYFANLETKLAESENKVKGFVELFDKKQHENYEQFCEIMQLKQQLAETEESYNNTMRYLNKTRSELLNLPKKIVSEIKDCLLDFSNGWWRYFMTDDCEYMLSSDLQGCLDEIIDTILKKYGGEDESNND